MLRSPCTQAHTPWNNDLLDFGSMTGRPKAPCWLHPSGNLSPLQRTASHPDRFKQPPWSESPNLDPHLHHYAPH
ncbi:hypothetical protein ILYODFUR_024803 [Ilyodon furcidens]|uniref:Uncharacterized protein n=1 Tax=Ilyodon furcidens TaxID=33524 RepID=A0ABV0UB52_9TELE